MKSIIARGAALLCLALLAAGCMPGAALANPGWTVVTVADGTVYGALATGQVVALNADDGTPRWSYPPVTERRSGGLGGLFARGGDDGPEPLEAVYGLPVLSDDLLLVCSLDGRLYAFESDTGRVRWSFSAGNGIVGGVTVDEGVAYFGSSDHRVYAVDLASGEMGWPQPFATENLIWGAPAVDASRVYIGSMDHYVYALDRQTGEMIWRQRMGSAVPGAVTLEDGVLYVGSIDRHLRALRADDGTILWERHLGHWVWGEALVREGYVYVGTLEGELHGLSVADGTPRWEPIPLVGAIRAGPVLLGERLVVGTEEGHVYLIDPESRTGELLGVAGAAVLSMPAVDGDRVYVGTTQAQIMAMDASLPGGPALWVYPPPK